MNANYGQTQPSQLPVTVGEQVKDVVVYDLIPVLITMALGYLSLVIKTQLIPILTELIPFTEKKATRKIKIKEFEQILPVLNRIIKVSAFDRVSLFMLNEYWIDNDDVINATSFSIAGQATKGLPERDDFNLSFGYISYEINYLYGNGIKFISRNRISESFMCPAWLKQRKTKAYAVFLLEDAKGIILLEKVKKFNFFNNKIEVGSWDKKCEIIDKIIH